MTDNRPLWFASFVLLVFCLGGLLGFRLGMHAAPDRPFGGGGLPGGRFGGGRPGPYGRADGPPPALPPDLIVQLTREVQLDAPQQEQVKKILEDRRDRFEQVHRDARERFDKETEDLHAAIRAVLRQDQQQSFDDFLDRRAPRGRGGRGGRR
jgi:hypothetical protein